MLASSASAPANSGLDPSDRNETDFVLIQLAVNAVNGQLLVGYNGVYTTTSNGDIVSGIIGPVTPAQPVTALAYGGMAGSTPKPNIIYAARGDTISVRTGSGNVFNYSAVVPVARITSIVLDPNNWQVAYAAGSGSVFATVDGGHTWAEITGSLAVGGQSTGLDTVELVKLPAGAGFPDGEDALLVGGTNGVFASYNPLGVPNGTNSYQMLPAALNNVPWSPLNLGLPGVLVSQISYTPTMTLKTPTGSQTRGNVLLISTLGAGVFQTNNATAKLGKTNVIVITGPANSPNAQVTIAPDPLNALNIRVQVVDTSIIGGPLKSYYFPANSTAGIQVSNLGAGVTLTIDTGLSFPGGSINFNGGGNANLVFVSPQPAATQSNTLTLGNKRTIVINGPNVLTVTYTNASTSTVVTPAYSSNFKGIAQGLSNLTKSYIGSAISEVKLAVFGSTVGNAVDRATVNASRGSLTRWPDISKGQPSGGAWTLREALRGRPELERPGPQLDR